jgi:hypothetical protein
MISLVESFWNQHVSELDYFTSNPGSRVVAAPSRFLCAAEWGGH